MRPPRPLVALLVGSLVGGSMAAAVTPASARPTAPRVVASVAATLGSATATAGDPTTLQIRVRPARAVRVQLQQAVAGRWRPYQTTTTARSGRAVVRIPTSVAGTRTFRVVRPVGQGRRAVSRPVRLAVVRPASACTPATPLVDPAATTPARCLVARLDRWQRAGVMAVGQQLNVSNDQYAAPLTALGGRRVPVVGFDLEELAASQAYGFAVPPIDDLVARARAGAVLSMSWHPANPATGGRHDDRTWTDLGALLSDPEQPGNVVSKRFWDTWTARLTLLRTLQDAGVAVVFRPFHEANGAWFWWGRPDAATYRRLWTELQRRTWAAGVHNVVWGYSFNAVDGSHVADPAGLLPARVDLAGLDSYSRAADPLTTRGYPQVARSVGRMAFTEAGPYETPDGSWNPAKITAAATSLTPSPLWAMLWFDDGGGKKQLSSLRGAAAWLRSCPDGFCLVRR